MNVLVPRSRDLPFTKEYLKKTYEKKEFYSKITQFFYHLFCVCLSLERLYLSTSSTPTLVQDLTTYFEFFQFQKTASN